MTRAQMTKQIQNPNDDSSSEEWYALNEENAFVLKEGAEQRQFNLEERTAKFGEAIIYFCKGIRASSVATPLISQLVRAGTSVGANFCEADNAVSKKEFRLKIGTCQKEARETKHWLRMMAAAVPEEKDAARILWQEARELHLIFSAILRKS
jgi:four helix bundle protein